MTTVITPGLLEVFQKFGKVGSVRNWCVVGGAMMDLMGIRDVGKHDIDVLVAKSYWNGEVEPSHRNNQSKTWRAKPCLSGQYETLEYVPVRELGPKLQLEILASQWGMAVGSEALEAYIRRAQDNKVEGIPCILPEDMLEWKLAILAQHEGDGVNVERHRRDAELLQDYLHLTRGPTCEPCSVCAFPKGSCACAVLGVSQC